MGTVPVFPCVAGRLAGGPGDRRGVVSDVQGKAQAAKRRNGVARGVSPGEQVRC